MTAGRCNSVLPIRTNADQTAPSLTGMTQVTPVNLVVSFDVLKALLSSGQMILAPSGLAPNMSSSTNRSNDASRSVSPLNCKLGHCGGFICSCSRGPTTHHPKGVNIPRGERSRCLSSVFFPRRYRGLQGCPFRSGPLLDLHRFSVS